MNLLKELKDEKNNLFQFYIIVGDGEKNKKLISNFLKENFDLKENEIFSKTGDDFKIDEARNFKKETFYSTNNKKQIFFLDYKKISFETQNALLKTFEDINPNSHFFLFVPNEDFLLNTIKSRGRIIFGEKKIDLGLAKKFQKASFKERKKIIEKFEKENISIFLDSLEILILEKKDIDKEFYKEFLNLKKYIFDKGVSIKNILTWIAIHF